MKQIIDQLRRAKLASRSLNNWPHRKVNELLKCVADKALSQSHKIIEANKLDLARMDQQDPKYDRLLLNDERLKNISADLLNLASLRSPLNRILEERTLPNGLELKKVSCPLGVVGIVYEARPNVTFDVFAICMKSGNVCVLKGSSDAKFSNIAIVSLIKEALQDCDLNTNVLQLLPSKRDAIKPLFIATSLVDLIIPRGSQGLIDFVRANSQVPIIETGAGIVHTYLDESLDVKMAGRIVVNAKTRRVSVCNALDTLIVHAGQLGNLSEIVAGLAAKNVVIFADKKAYESLLLSYPRELLQKASASSYGTEFLSHKMSVKTVNNIADAIEHINQYSSKHSEAIISADNDAIETFEKNIDAAVVYTNTSTAFTDGAQFGLGAEIGISTQKLHARGPMGPAELTSYKWLVKGNGQTRD